MKVRNFIYIGSSYMLGILFIILINIFKVNYSLVGFTSVLESIINFSSIIIGFYTAMYGILVTIKDKQIFKEISNFNLEGLFKYQLYESLISTFIILILSISLQIFVNYHIWFTHLLFNIWCFILIVFLVSAVRTIHLLIKIMFNHEDKKNDYHLSDKLTSEQMERIKRISNNVK